MKKAIQTPKRAFYDGMVDFFVVVECSTDLSCSQKQIVVAACQLYLIHVFQWKSA